MMCQCRFIDWNKCITMVADTIKREAMHVGGQGIYGNSLVPAQFCSEPTYNALKNRDLLKNGKKK